MSGYPIRIAVRVDFSDGSEHEYEVRGQDAVQTADLPRGPMQGFWPEGVVTTDVAERMKHDAAREKALADAVSKLCAVRSWAEHMRDMDSGAQPGDPRETGFVGAVADVLKILDAP